MKHNRMIVRGLIAFFGLTLAFAQDRPLDNIASRQYQHEVRPLPLALDRWLHQLGLQQGCGFYWRMLSPKRDQTAAKLFLRLALSGTVVPDSYRGLFTITCQRIAQSILERTEPGLVVPPLEGPVAEDRLADLL